jgi:hypothetical protein
VGRQQQWRFDEDRRDGFDPDQWPHPIGEAVVELVGGVGKSLVRLTRFAKRLDHRHKRELVFENSVRFRT